MRRSKVSLVVSLRRSAGLPRLALGSAAVVVAGLLPAFAVAAAASAAVASPPPAGGGASAFAAAVVQAQSSGKRVEVPAADTATTVTYANPDGTATAVVSQVPVRARQADGTWAPLDLNLSDNGGVLEPARAATAVSVSKGGAGTFATLKLSGSQSVGLGWASALPTPTVSGREASYALSPTATLTVDARPDGFGSRVVLTQPPTSAPVWRLPLDLEGLAAKQAQNGSVRLASDSGVQVAEIQPLLMWDAQQNEAGDPSNLRPVNATLVNGPAGEELDVAPSMAWLSDPSTQYPVTIDPTVSSVTNHGDTFVSGSGATGNTTPQGSQYNLYVGSFDGTNVNRPFIDFDIAQFAGDMLSDATLTLYQYDAGSCSPLPMSVRPITSALNEGSMVWANAPAYEPANRWYLAPSFNRGVESCGQTNGPESFDMTEMVEGWASGALSHFGIRMTAPAGSETDITYRKYFCARELAPAGTGHCDVAGEGPTLSVTYYIKYGIEPSYSLTQHRLNDRSQLYVNNENGNSVLVSHDVHIRGRGLDLNIDRFYNSSSTSSSGVFGVATRMSGGPDVKLMMGSTATGTDWFDYRAPGGALYGGIVRQDAADSNPAHRDTTMYYPMNQGGLDADLKDNGDGTFTMTFHKTQEKYVFAQAKASCSTCDYVMSKDIDKNGNEIDYAYNSTNGQLTSITDTEGRVLTVHYGANGFIDKFTDSTGRIWQYGYTGSDLTSYTDPNTKVYNYTVVGDQITQIQDPAGSDANNERPTTNLGYTNLQTTSLQYVKDGTTGAVFEFDFIYHATKPARCKAADPDDFGTDVTDVSDPQGGTTTYCFQNATEAANPSTSLNDRKVHVIDGLGNKRTSGYQVDNSASALTDPVNDGVTNGSTVFAYDPTTNQKLSSITESRDAGSTAGATSYFDYQGSGAASFAPTSMTSSSGSCTAYAYDIKGNLTDSYAGNSPTGNACSGLTTGSHNHIDYNTDGTVKDSYSPTGSSTLKTTYTYFTTNPNAGQVKQATRVSGNTTCTTDRTLCTTYTYDGLSRIASTTDGNGNTTTYHYDVLDRVTEVDLAGASSCDTYHDNCFSYTYDAEGNLTLLQNAHGTSRSMIYDRLNRPAKTTLNGGSNLITTYDGAGNLTHYGRDTADTVDYTYNAANELTKIVDATGTMTVAPDADGRRQSIALPNGVTINYTYHSNGQVKTISTTGGSGLPGTQTYTYTKGTTETDKLQKVTVGATSTFYGYDLFDRLCWVGTSAFSSCTGTTGRSYGYTYDADNNLTKAIAGATTTLYGYNRADELCWSGAVTGTQLGTTCPATPVGDTTFNNDKAGNGTGTSTGPIVYNSANQASSITALVGGTAVAMGYGDQGNSLRETAGGDNFAIGALDLTDRLRSGRTFYTRDPYGNVIDEHGAAGTYYYLTDRLGSVTTLISSTGTNAGSYTYDPFGKITNLASLTTAATDNPWTYAGGYYDNEGDGYYHFGARYYDAAGHFTQPDSVIGNIASPQTVNLYSYTSGDPINGTDLSGKSILGAIIGGGLTAIGSVATAAAAYVTYDAFGAFAASGTLADLGILGASFGPLGLALGLTIGAGLLTASQI